MHADEASQIQGKHIQAVVPKYLIKKFKEKLQEGEVYSMKHFNVAKNKRKHKPVHNEYIIWFTSYTSITWEQTNVDKIGMHCFEIIPFHKLHERNNRYDIVTDVIGLLIGVENAVTDEYGNIRKRLYIQDQREQKVMVTLWNEKTYLVSADNNNDQDPKILIITSTRVTQYNGNYQLGSPSATKIYINMNNLDVQHFKEE
ncbi:uncharacterized protein [Spinacia oleracea]|nr:uncharacterized protein LOC110783488 isoform X3 [Spinacia oleracea]